MGDTVQRSYPSMLHNSPETKTCSWLVCIFLACYVLFGFVTFFRQKKICSIEILGSQTLYSANIDDKVRKPRKYRSLVHFSTGLPIRQPRLHRLLL